MNKTASKNNGTKSATTNEVFFVRCSEKFMDDVHGLEQMVNAFNKSLGFKDMDVDLSYKSYDNVQKGIVISITTSEGRLLRIVAKDDIEFIQAKLRHDEEFIQAKLLYYASAKTKKNHIMDVLGLNDSKSADIIYKLIDSLSLLPEPLDKVMLGFMKQKGWKDADIQKMYKDANENINDMFDDLYTGDNKNVIDSMVNEYKKSAP